MSAAGQADLIRTHDNGAVFVSVVVGTPKRRLREARQRIAWCGTDNLAMSRAVASVSANGFDGKSSYRVGPFTFELVASVRPKALAEGAG